MTRPFDAFPDYSTIDAPTRAREDAYEAKEAAIDVAWDAFVAFLPGWLRARKLSAWRRDLRELLAQAPIHNRSYIDAFAPENLIRADGSLPDPSYRK